MDLKDYNLPNLRVRAVALPRYGSYLRCLKGVFSPEPLEIAYYNFFENDAGGREEMGRVKYDLIFYYLILHGPLTRQGIARRKKS